VEESVSDLRQDEEFMSQGRGEQKMSNYLNHSSILSFNKKKKGSFIKT